MIIKYEESEFWTVRKSKQFEDATSGAENIFHTLLTFFD